MLECDIIDYAALTMILLGLQNDQQRHDANAVIMMTDEIIEL